MKREPVGGKPETEVAAIIVSRCTNPDCPMNGRVIESLVKNEDAVALNKCPHCRRSTVKTVEERTTIEYSRRIDGTKGIAHAYLR